jgi:ribonuclease HII
MNANVINNPCDRVSPHLKTCYNENNDIMDIGIDESGRGPMFGRVYTSAVILPKDDSFDHSRIKDSKKFHSKKKIEEVANYIKENAIAWSVTYEDEKVIDEINILQATQKSMHKSILEVYKKLDVENNKICLLVDGNYFNPLILFNKNTFETIPHITIEGGDDKYTPIAAASILAKVERDNYINDLCKCNPTLSEYYGIDKNKGYGTKKHLDGIRQHGITEWHRKTFGICKGL